MHKIQNLKRSYHNKGNGKLSFNELYNLELGKLLDDIDFKLFSLQIDTEVERRLSIMYKVTGY